MAIHLLPVRTFKPQNQGWMRLVLDQRIARAMNMPGFLEQRVTLVVRARKGCVASAKIGQAQATECVEVLQPVRWPYPMGGGLPYVQSSGPLILHNDESCHICQSFTYVRARWQCRSLINQAKRP